MALVLTLGSTGVAEGQTTWLIPEDHASIQAAVVAASPGDEVLVSPGVYVEHVDFLGKDLEVRSTAGPSVTVIRGVSASPVVALTSGESRAALLEGFRIEPYGGGLSVPVGGGVLAQNSSPTLRGNVIVGHRARSGGGVAAIGGSALIEQNEIALNESEDEGGGLYVDGGAPEVRGNLLSANTATAGSGAMLVASSVVFTRNTVHDNEGAWGTGVMVAYGAAVIDRCTIARNFGSEGGGLALASATGTKVTNTIVWAHGSLLDIVVWDDSGPIEVSYSNYGSLAPLSGQPLDITGRGNISLDPLFVDASAGNYELLPGSPCIDSGDPSAPLDDDLTVADMGAHPFVPPFQPWVDLGQALAGTAGEPTQIGQGQLAGDDLVALTLSQARAFSLAWLVLGVTSLSAPFKGGVLIPAPDLTLPQFTDGFGEASLGGTWPPGIPSGLSFWSQWWIQDPAGPVGFAASNGVEATTP